MLANAAVADTLRAAQATPAIASVTTGSRSFARLRRPSLLIRAETPQLRASLLADAADVLDRFDAVLGPTAGDGWWAFGLSDPRYAETLGSVPESFPELALAVLRAGLRVAMLPALRAVESAADIGVVARLCPPGSAFAATAARLSAVPAA